MTLSSDIASAEVELIEAIHELPLESAEMIGRVVASSADFAFNTWSTSTCQCPVGAACTYHDPRAVVDEAGHAANILGVDERHLEAFIDAYDVWAATNSYLTAVLDGKAREDFRVLFANALATHPDRFVNDNNPED